MNLKIVIKMKNDIFFNYTEYLDTTAHTVQNPSYKNVKVVQRTLSQEHIFFEKNAK